jgi:hypothetical protein
VEKYKLCKQKVRDQVWHGYKLRTKSGVLRGLYTRNQFELSDNNFLVTDTVQLETEISLRQAVSDASICDGQGFTRHTTKSTLAFEHIEHFTLTKHDFSHTVQISISSPSS